MLSKEKLEQLVAPIALHPDALLSQILMASTYPLELVQAERWLKANPKLSGKALEDALQTQPWDPSVKSLTATPDVVQMMNDKLDWTQQLGDAFLAQQQDVLAAIQVLRERADKSGNLKSTKQQKVTKTSPVSGGSGGSQIYSAPQSYYVIEPQDPAVVYVPAYDPGYIYGTWPYSSYPPYSWYPPGYVAGRALWFGAAVAVGGALWGNCDWGRGNVNIDVSRYNNFNRANISNGNWQHNVSHRKGVPYANKGVANQFRGQTQNRAASREQFRGRADAGRKDLAGSAGKQTARQAAGKQPSQLAGKGTGQAAKGERAAAAKKSTQQAGKGAGQAAKGERADAAKKSTQRAGGAKATAFDKAGSGAKVRSQSARGQTSRAASASHGGGGRPSMSRGGGGGGRSIGGGGGGRGGGRRSDIRVKHDIVLLGELDNGLGYYRFAYNGSHKQYVGVMAQEVTRVVPQAVVRDKQGYLRVYYDELGLKFQTYDKWIASGGRLPQMIGH
jgi:hypothetical protein